MDSGWTIVLVATSRASISDIIHSTPPFVQDVVGSGAVFHTPGGKLLGGQWQYLATMAR